MALTTALAVARGNPSIAPVRLRPFAGFTKADDRAWEAAWKALDESEELRVAVAAEVDGEGDVGRAGWLLLTRPEGWQAELEALLAAEADADADGRGDAKGEGAARRKLKRVEERLAEAERARDDALKARRKASDDLAGERARRREAEESAAGARREVGRLEDALRAAEAREAAVAGDRDRLARELEEARRGERELRDRATALAREAESARVDARAAAEAGAADAERVAGAAGAIAAAADGAAALAAGLADAAARLGWTAPDPATSTEHPEPHTRSRPEESADESSGRGTAGGGGERQPRSGAARVERRRPAKLPPATLEDSAEAVRHLVRLPAALLVVDGYNAALPQWPGLPLAEQRERLVGALDELSLRTGIEIHVVFDGVTTSVRRPDPRSRVRVAFTEEGVEADDVILDLVDSEPAGRVVIVASNDHRVRDGARHRGANVVTTDQLLTAAERAR